MQKTNKLCTFIPSNSSLYAQFEPLKIHAAQTGSSLKAFIKDRLYFILHLIRADGEPRPLSDPLCGLQRVSGGVRGFYQREFTATRRQLQPGSVSTADIHRLILIQDHQTDAGDGFHVEPPNGLNLTRSVDALKFKTRCCCVGQRHQVETEVILFLFIYTFF